MANPDLLHVICHRPGLIRGGRSNPASASYEPGAFTAAQLAELAAEPEITLLLGHTPDEEDLAALAKPDEEDGKAKAKGKAKPATKSEGQ